MYYTISNDSVVELWFIYSQFIYAVCKCFYCSMYFIVFLGGNSDRSHRRFAQRKILLVKLDNSANHPNDGKHSTNFLRGWEASFSTRTFHNPLLECR